MASSCPRREFGETVGPALRDAMCRGGIEDLGGIRTELGRERDRVLGGLVGEAQDHEVGFAQQLPLRGRILALLGRD